jgi:hypothetical protein
MYLQEKEPSVPARHGSAICITVHYRNDIHALSRCMDSVQPRTPSV